MRALTVVPRRAGSASLEDVPEPAASEGPVLVQAHSVGVCGTDREILDGEYGEAPPANERLVLGHESLGRVLEAPKASGLSEGDWVVGIVRRPDPVPCASCASGEWDMCSNGRYTEHGIKGLHGFARERYRLRPQDLVKVKPAAGELGVLLEPASVVAKAWDQIDRIGRRAVFAPTSVLVVGAGPIGLLAALLAVQRGLRVQVVNRSDAAPKPALVRELGAELHVGNLAELGLKADIVIECTGAAPVIAAAMRAALPNGIVCLTGVTSAGAELTVDVGALNRELVLGNIVVFGAVNANRAHYEQAADALAWADHGWLARLITRDVPLDRWQEALEHRRSDVKTVLRF